MMIIVDMGRINLKFDSCFFSAVYLFKREKSMILSKYRKKCENLKLARISHLLCFIYKSPLQSTLKLLDGFSLSFGH